MDWQDSRSDTYPAFPEWTMAHTRGTTNTAAYWVGGELIGNVRSDPSSTEDGKAVEISWLGNWGQSERACRK